MRIAALYDIHGNLRALEAALADVDAARVDRILVGGDVVLGPLPGETLERLNARGDQIVFIRGNTDRVVVTPPAAGLDAAGVWGARRHWVAERLMPAQHDQLSRWPETVVLDVDGLGEVLFCHGSPRSDDEILTPITSERRLREILAGVGPRVVVHGHSHIRYDRTVLGTRLVNPGSVGMPYEGTPGAYWALLGPEVELRRSVYDFARAAAEIRACGFPDAGEFADQNVLASPSASESATFFEEMAEKRAAKS